MDRQLRQQIKHDKFVEEVGHTVEYLSEHKAAVRKYGGIVLGAVVLAGAGYGFMRWQENSRQAELRIATQVLDAYVGEVSPYGGPVFKTQADKDNAALKAFSELASKHSGAKEGQIARYYTGTLLCDMGKIAGCEAAFKEAAGGRDGNVASLARLSLATLYQSQNKLNEAESVLRQLVNNPTAVVSKEQAQISLARVISKSKPQEARQILESLQALERPAVTRAAVSALGEMAGQSPK
ncbi:MAG: tetratricopeptide repeat protein [Acidobacteria bacterium]|nr:tetratricopeptide repeat protein [Acidobacteriota bacterium]